MCQEHQIRCEGWASLITDQRAEPHVAPLESFILITLITSIESGATVLVLPYRHLLHTARVAADIDRFSGGLRASPCTSPTALGKATASPATAAWTRSSPTSPTSPRWPNSARPTYCWT